MTYQIMNPFTPPTVTRIDTETGEVWHSHPDGTRERSDRPIDYWLRYVDVDRDLEMDEGL